jgi:hypothetical protein
VSSKDKRVGVVRDLTGLTAINCGKGTAIMNDNTGTITAAIIGGVAVIAASLIGLIAVTNNGKSHGEPRQNLASPTAATSSAPSPAQTSIPGSAASTGPVIYHQANGVVLPEYGTIDLNAPPDNHQWSDDSNDLRYGVPNLDPYTVGTEIVAVGSDSSTVCQDASGYNSHGLVKVRVGRMFCFMTELHRFVFGKVVKVTPGVSVTLDLRSYALPTD